MKTPLATTNPTFQIYRNSIAVGFLCALATLAALFGMALFDLWQYGYLELHWIYERGGFPCIGIFAITSASYVVTRVFPTRFFAALLLISVCTIACWMMGVIDIIPRMYKSAETVHWLRIPFLLWLTIPPWLTAVGVIVLRTIRPAIIQQSPKSET